MECCTGNAHTPLWQNLPPVVFPLLSEQLKRADYAAVQLTCKPWYTCLGPALDELSPSSLVVEQLVKRFPNITLLDLTHCKVLSEYSLLPLVRLRKLYAIRLNNTLTPHDSTIKYPGCLALSRLPHLTHLTLERFWTLSTADLAPLTSLARLHSLCLHWSCAAGEGYQGLPVFPRLQHLQLIGLDLDDTCLMKVSLHHHLTSLHFDLSQSHSTSGEGFQHLSKLTALQSLQMAAAEHLTLDLDTITHLSSLSRLTSLDLSKWQVCSSKGFKQLSAFKALARLSLASPLQSMEDISSPEVTPLVVLPSLTQLRLHNMPLDRMRVADITHCPALCSLSLSSCQLSAQVLAHLPSCTALWEVELVGCRGEFGEGIRSIAWSHSLTRLHLEAPMGTTPEQVGALTRLRDLRQLYLSSTGNTGNSSTSTSGTEPLQDCHVERLLPALPNLQALQLQHASLGAGFLQILPMLRELRELDLSRCAALPASTALPAIGTLPRLSSMLVLLSGPVTLEDCSSLTGMPQLATAGITLQQGWQEPWHVRQLLQQALSPGVEVRVTHHGDGVALPPASRSGQRGGLLLSGGSRRQTRSLMV